MSHGSSHSFIVLPSFCAVAAGRVHILPELRNSAMAFLVPRCSSMYFFDVGALATPRQEACLLSRRHCIESLVCQADRDSPATFRLPKKIWRAGTMVGVYPCSHSENWAVSPASPASPAQLVLFATPPLLGSRSQLLALAGPIIRTLVIPTATMTQPVKSSELKDQKSRFDYLSYR